MACAIRSAITFLSVSAVAGMLTLACSSSDGDDTNGVGGAGGGAKATGGAKTTGGAKATGGKAGTGGSNAVGGATATGTGAATGGATLGVGGAVNTGGAVAATGGSPDVGGASAAGGTLASVGGDTGVGGASAAVGGTSAGGTSTTLPKCIPSDPDAGAITGVFCGVTSSELDLSTICATGCQTGDVTMTGTSTGLNIAGTIYSKSNVFFGNPVPNNVQGGSCDGFSATDPTSHQPYTSMSIGLKNNMASAQTIVVTLLDVASGDVPTSYTLKASVTVPAGATVEQVLRWGNESSRCQSDAGNNCTEFEPQCTLDPGASFDPTHLQKLGLAVGDSTTTYPLNNVDIVITSVSFN